MLNGKLHFSAVLFINFMVVSAMSIKHLHERSGEQIGLSPAAGKKVKPTSNSAIFGHVIYSNYIPYFFNSSILAHANENFG